MKNNYFILCVTILLFTNSIYSQNTKKKQLSSPILSDTHLVKNTTYILKDTIEVTNGAILTIDEGVTLKTQDNSTVTITIDKGSKVIAFGSYENPIKIDTNSENNGIVMKSSLTTETSTYHYKQIEHPTVLMNLNPVSETQVSSVD